MAQPKNSKKAMSTGDLIMTIIVGTLCLGATIFGYWNIISGWNQPNAIIKFFSSFNDTSLGFGPFVMVHGVANWAVNSASFYFMAVPIIFLISLVANKKKFDIISTLIVIVIGAVAVAFLFGLCAFLLYSAKYMLDEHPLFSGIVTVVGILAIIVSACCSLGLVVVVIGGGSKS